MRWGCQCWCRRGPKIDWINIHRNRLILQFLIAIWQFTEFVRNFQSKNNSLKLFQVAFRQHLCPSITNKLFTTQIHKKNPSKEQKSKQKLSPLQFPGKKIPNTKFDFDAFVRYNFWHLSYYLVGGSQLSGGVYVAALSSRCTEELRRRPSAAELSDIVTLSVGRRSWVSVVEQKVLSTQFTRNCKCVWSKTKLENWLKKPDLKLQPYKCSVSV